MFVSDRFFEQPAPGLGPPRSLQHGCLSRDATCLATVFILRQFPTRAHAHVLRRKAAHKRCVVADTHSHRRLIATVPPRPLTQRGGLAVSRLDGRGISLEKHRVTGASPDAPRGASVPDPFLGSSCVLPIVTDRLSRLWVRRIAPRGGSLLAKRCATGGDVNPDCSLTDAFTPISFGWPRRWPPAPAVPAIDCFARLTVAWKPDSVRQEPFPFSSVTSVLDDRRNISGGWELAEKKGESGLELSTVDRK